MKKWMIAAAIVMAVGCGLFVGAMTMIGWDFMKLSTDKFSTNTHIVGGDFTDIVLTASTAKITFLPAEDDKVTVVCCEAERQQHAVTVQDGILKIEQQDTRKWYHYIGISFQSPTITVYLPVGEYGSLTLDSHTGEVNIPADFSFKNVDVALTTGDIVYRASATGDVKIKTSTGDITTENITASSLSLVASTGKITATDVVCVGDVTMKVSTGKSFFTNVTCRNLKSEGTTGDTTLKNVVAEKQMFIERDTGDVTLTLCDAAELWLETSTGDIKGSLLSDKVFITNTDTGRVNVPQTATGGRCEIITDTGNITMSIG